MKSLIPIKTHQGGKTDFPDFRQKTETGVENAKDGWSTIAKLRWLVRPCPDSFPLKNTDKS